MAPWAGRPRRFLPVLLTGSYVWFVTVAPVLGESSGASVGPPWLPAAFALLSWVLLGLASVAPSRAAALGLGLYGFLGSAALAWATHRDLPTSPLTRFFGVLGFATYTLAWGALSKPLPSPAPSASAADPAPKAELAARATSPRVALLVPALAAAGGLILLAPLGEQAASLAERPHIEVLAHLLALLGAFLSVRQAAQWGSDLHFRLPGSQLRSPIMRWPADLLGLCLLVLALASWLVAQHNFAARHDATALGWSLLGFSAVWGVWRLALLRTSGGQPR